MRLFKNQQRALQIIHKEDKGIFHHICGSGKSYIYVTAARQVGRTLVFVPRKVLVEQFYEDYFAGNESFDVIKINSDQKRLSETEAEFWLRFNVKGVPSKPMVALVNYQSLNRLVEGMKGGVEVFDMVFCDEAHNVNGDGRMMQQLSQQQPIGKKIFFFTATPNEIMLDRPDIFGPVLDVYNYAEAVRDGIVKTFNTHIECLNQNVGTPLLWSIGQFILRQGLKRVVIYTNMVQEGRKNAKRSFAALEDQEAEAEDMEDMEEIVEDTKPTKSQKESERVRASMALNTFQKEAMKTLPRGIRVDYITAKTSLDQRYHMFRRFRDEKDSTTRLIVSCKTISEGVDLTSCDAVILLDSRSNRITTTQRILRCTRLTKKERLEKTWKPAVVLIPLVGYSTASYRKDEQFAQWLHQFSEGLQCHFQEGEVIPAKRNSFPLSLMIGDNVDEIPYDPRERTDDPLRERVANFLGNYCKELLSSSDTWTCERGIFDYTCRMSEFHNPPYSRNWDSPYFSRVYKERARCVAFNLKRQWEEGMDLYKFAALYSTKEMNAKYHMLFELKEREALKRNPNASADQFMRPGWKGVDVVTTKLRTGIPCTQGCLKNSSPDDPDRGYRVTYTQLQTRSSDEPCTVFYYCPECAKRWKGE